MCPDHPSGHLFVEGKKDYCEALIKILLLAITIAAKEFCHQHLLRLMASPSATMCIRTLKAFQLVSYEKSNFQWRWVIRQLILDWFGSDSSGQLTKQKAAANELAMFVSMSLPRPALLKSSSGPCWTALKIHVDCWPCKERRYYLFCAIRTI